MCKRERNCWYYSLADDSEDWRVLAEKCRKVGATVLAIYIKTHGTSDFREQWTINLLLEESVDYWHSYERERLAGSVLPLKKTQRISISW